VSRSEDDQRNLLDEYLKLRLKRRNSVRGSKPLHPKLIEVFENGRRILTTESRHEALRFIMDNSGMEFKEAMESGWGWKKGGELIFGTDKYDEAIVKGIRVSKGTAKQANN
jgi:hypothetical protein